MGKRKLLTSIILGATVGGITALCDKEVRHYAKEKWGNFKNSSTYALKHPAEAARNVQFAMNQLHDNLNYQTENAINALEQVESTIGSVTGKVKRINK
ncbi:YtxH domain-containing protein [Virgibacillus soli]|uniref:YtxH domain-containing protein n=1 Tax=Paracerasibacillus soli TaxID=480284 RepID=UPI0035E50B46